MLLPQWLDQSLSGHVSQHRLHRKHEPVYTAGLLTGSSEGRAQCHHKLAHGDSHLRNMLKRVTEQGTARARDAVWKPRQPHHAGLPPERGTADTAAERQQTARAATRRGTFLHLRGDPTARGQQLTSVWEQGRRAGHNAFPPLPRSAAPAPPRGEVSPCEKGSTSEAGTKGT